MDLVEGRSPSDTDGVLFFRRLATESEGGRALYKEHRRAGKIPERDYTSNLITFDGWVATGLLNGADKKI